MKDTKSNAKKDEGYPTLAFSFPPDLAEYINTRWRQLRPTISSKSHFMQLLVDAERKGHCKVGPKINPALLAAGELKAA